MFINLSMPSPKQSLTYMIKKESLRKKQKLTCQESKILEHAQQYRGCNPGGFLKVKQQKVFLT